MVCFLDLIFVAKMIGMLLPILKLKTQKPKKKIKNKKHKPSRTADSARVADNTDSVLIYILYKTNEESNVKITRSVTLPWNTFAKLQADWVQ